MEYKENTQLVLPYELEKTPEYQEKIKASWKYIFSRQVLTSVYTKRTLACIIAQIKEENKVKEFYQIRTSDIIQETGLDRAAIYRNMKTIVYELDNVVYYFEDDETQTFIPRRLVDTSRYKNPVGYYNGVLTVAFNPTLKDIILQLAQYTEYELSIYMKFSSWYSMRLYELLSSFKDRNSGWWLVNINEYRELMGCGYELDKKGRVIMDKKTGLAKVKYPNPANLILKTTQEPLKELENTDCAFTVSPVYDETKAGKGRRPIVAIRFELKTTKISANEQIKKWCENSVEFKKMYERLKKFKILDESIVKYSKAIGKKRHEELLKDWNKKMDVLHPNHILDVEKYCNSVYSKEGQKAIETQPIKNLEENIIQNPKK